MITESGLDLSIRSRINQPIVGFLYDAFSSCGMTAELTSLVNSVPEQHQPPILQTLATHVTKEKPIFVRSLSQSSSIKPAEINTIAVATDFLWTLSLMYDDMFDADERRAGLPTSWVSFGRTATSDAMQYGLDAVTRRCAAVYGSDISTLCMKYVRRGVDSLDEHKAIGLDIDQRSLIDNYNKRAEFHTLFPIDTIKSVDTQWTQYEDAKKALVEVNLAGQILNDVKDFSSERYFGRPSLSDLRNGLVTIPLLVLWQSLNDSTDRSAFREVFGKQQLTDEESARLISLMQRSSALTLTAKLIADKYQSSNTCFKEVVQLPSNQDLVAGWFKYKAAQLKELS